MKLSYIWIFVLWDICVDTVPMHVHLFYLFPSGWGPHLSSSVRVLPPSSDGPALLRPALSPGTAPLWYHPSLHRDTRKHTRGKKKEAAWSEQEIEQEDAETKTKHHHTGCCCPASWRRSVFIQSHRQASVVHYLNWSSQRYSAGPTRLMKWCIRQDCASCEMIWSALLWIDPVGVVNDKREHEVCGCGVVVLPGSREGYYAR